MHRRSKKDGEENAQPAEQQQDTSAVGVGSSLRSHVADHGGATIFAYKVARFVSVLALLALYIASFVHDYEIVGTTDIGSLGKKKKARKAAEFSRREWVDLILCITYVSPFRHSVCATLYSSSALSYTRHSSPSLQSLRKEG